MRPYVMTCGCKLGIRSLCCDLRHLKLNLSNHIFISLKFTRQKERERESKKATKKKIVVWTSL